MVLSEGIVAPDGTRVVGLRGHYCRLVGLRDLYSKVVGFRGHFYRVVGLRPPNTRVVVLRGHTVDLLDVE